MVSNNRYFFLNKEILIYSVIKSLNLAKVHYLDNSELFLWIWVLLLLRLRMRNRHCR